MKKICTLMLLGAFAASASAQHLPNVGFDSWKGNGNAGSTYQSSTSALFGGKTNDGMRQRPGDEPVDWLGGSINQKVAGTEKKQELIYKVSEGGNTWVKMANAFVGIKIGTNTIGSVAPGFLNFGTPWVYAVSKIANCDGGTYGGRSFTYKPDAVAGRFKKTPVATIENSYIIAYLWSGTFNSQIASTSTADADKYRDDVERAILGSVSATGVTAPTNVKTKGKLIAWCNYAYQTTENNDWQTIEVPLTYEDVNAVPEKMNVIVSSGDYYTRGNLQDGTVVEVDDLDFVYWNTLSSLQYDGVELLDGDETAYDLSSVAYNPAKLEATAKSLFGAANVSYDEDTNIATIIVTREYADAKTYTIQFKAGGSGEPGKQGSDKTYTKDIIVNVNGEASAPQAANIVVTYYDDETIDFTLKNFCLGEGEYALPVGNIALTDLAISEGKFSYNDNLTIQPGDDEDIEWFGPYLGELPLNLTGEITDSDGFFYVNIDLDLSDLGQIVNVQVGESVSAPLALSAAKVGTFVAPFEVTIPVDADNGEALFAASTITSQENGILTLVPCEGTIPAQTPVVIQGEAAEYAFAAIKTRSYVAPTAPSVSGILTGVYKQTVAPVGSYVLQNQNDHVGFYKVVDVQPTVKANRCYITLPAGSNVRALFFGDDLTTAINAAVTTTVSSPIFDLQGRRVGSAAQKGVFIVGGKKVVK